MAVDSRAKGARAVEYLYIIKHISIPIIYIGITCDISRRIAEHRNNSSNRLLREYITKYGWRSFNTTHIEIENRDLAEELEQLLIKEVKTLGRYIVCNILEGSVSVGESCQKGSSHWNSHLTEEDIINIRNIYNTGGITQKTIGEIYNCSNKVISKVTTGYRWKHVNAPTIKNSIANKVANRRKLSDDECIKAREEALEEYNITGSVDIPTMAELYGISRQSMRLILKGISYARLSGPKLGIDYYKEFGK